jgi:hypothetical protein
VPLPKSGSGTSSKTAAASDEKQNVPLPKIKNANQRKTLENKAPRGSGTPNVPLPKSGSGTGQFSTRGWRVEINTKSDGVTRFWIRRRGRGQAREARYGGMFRTLSIERQEQYKHNRRAYEKRRKATASRKKKAD